MVGIISHKSDILIGQEIESQQKQRNRGRSPFKNIKSTPLKLNTRPRTALLSSQKVNIEYALRF